MIEYNASEQTEIPEANGFSVKIIGVGGSGANVLDRMALEGSEAGDLLTINTDVRALSTSVSSNKIQLGKELLMGMGAGGDPELGREAALEAEAEIRDAVRGYSMVFVCVGLGGGTGSGAAPEVCRIAREEGAFLVAFTSLPFGFEGKRRMQQATDSLKGIGEFANAVVTFENDRMGELLVAKEGIQQAFAAADKLISQSILATTNMVTQPGIIRLGMDDLLTALRNRDSRCLFGFGLAKGDNRAQEALAQALKSPLIDKNYLMDSAENVLIHISGGDSLTLYEVEILMNELAKHVSDQAQILFGVGTDKKLGNSLAVTLISSVSSEKIGPSGTARKKEADKKKALTSDDSGDDGDDDGSGGGAGKPSDNSASSETAVKAETAAEPPPPDELTLDATLEVADVVVDTDAEEMDEEWAPLVAKQDEPPELPVEGLEDEDAVEGLVTSADGEEPVAVESEVLENEDSAEISSSALLQADDEISAEEVVEEDDDQEEEEGEASPEFEEEVEADQEEEEEESLEEEIEADAVVEEEGELAIEDEVEVDSDTLDESEEEALVEQEQEDAESEHEELVEVSDEEDELPSSSEDEWADPVAQIEEAAPVQEESSAPVQGMASLLGLKPVSSGEDDEEISLEGGVDDEPEEQEQQEQVADEIEDEAEDEPSPFEIDDDDEELEVVQDQIPVEIEEQEVAEVKPSAPMSILQIAKQSLVEQKSQPSEDELIVHSFDEGDDEQDETDEDEDLVSLGFEEDEDSRREEEQAASEQEVQDVILSASAGDDGDMEITLSRVDEPDDIEEEEVADAEPVSSVDKTVDTEEGFGEHEQAAAEEEVTEEQTDLDQATERGAVPQKQGVLELESEVKGRFAKTKPTIVDGQDLDVPTFLRARRD
ncbi:MAG: hypothetical protein L3J39_07960 [Verrucomicrobiales bacterium]|nr:hypothetical protein [Verrucomicrobiales bacterium]